jgi:hypothetical protein
LLKKELGMKINKKRNLLVGVALTGMMIGGAVLAGATETTFGVSTDPTTPLGMVTSYLQGSLGQLISLLALGVAVTSAITGKLSGIVTALGVALALQVGPGLITSLLGSTLP